MLTEKQKLQKKEENALFVTGIQNGKQKQKRESKLRELIDNNIDTIVQEMAKGTTVIGIAKGIKEAMPKLRYKTSTIRNEISAALRRNNIFERVESPIKTLIAAKQESLQTPEQTLAQTQELAPEQTPEQTPETTPEQALGQAPEQTPPPALDPAKKHGKKPNLGALQTGGDGKLQ